MRERPLSIERVRRDVVGDRTTEVIYLMEMPGDIVHGSVTLVTVGGRVERTVLARGTVVGHDTVDVDDPPAIVLDASCPPAVATAVHALLRQRAKTI